MSGAEELHRERRARHELAELVSQLIDLDEAGDAAAEERRRIRAEFDELAARARVWRPRAMPSGWSS